MPLLPNNTSIETKEVMEQQHQVTLFSQPNCPRCRRVKKVLRDLSCNYREYDTSHPRYAYAAMYFSGVSTVPQIFIGTYHINGVNDLERLRATGELRDLLNKIKSPPLPAESVSDAALSKGAEDWLLRTTIPKNDGVRGRDPEIWPALNFIQKVFGFWPNSHAYLYHWPEAYKLFLYCQDIPAIHYGQRSLGTFNALAISYATSKAHGCTYSQVHSVALGKAVSLKIARQLQQATAENKPYDNPFSALVLAMTELAGEATCNQVPRRRIVQIIDEIRDFSTTSATISDYIAGVEMVIATFGFLNVFNELIGTELEDSWAQQAKEHSGIEPGRHASQAASLSNSSHPSPSNPSNLEDIIPTDGPSVEMMMAKYDDVIEDLADYAEREFGLLPDWLRLWPTGLQKRQAYFYGEVMGNRQHSPLSAELKHLMARVSAIATDHSYLAAIEGYIACHTSIEDPRIIDRIRHCFSVASGKQFHPDLFSERERAALTFAWLAAQIPLRTPRRFVQPVTALYSAKELVQLSVVCSLSSSLQRFVATTRPEIEPEVSQLLQKQRLTSNPLLLRYPNPE